MPCVPKTYAYGKAFEQLVITEIYRLNMYEGKDYRLSYLLTKDHAEIDLVIDRPQGDSILVEIKSNTLVTEHDANVVNRFIADWPNQVKGVILSQDPITKKIGQLMAYHWITGIHVIFDGE